MWPAITSQLCPQLLGPWAASNSSTSVETTSNISPMVGYSYPKVLSLQCFPSPFYLPSELWKAPSLQQLLASANELTSIAPDIIYCQTLQKLSLDRNKLSSLPPQLTGLKSLEELSLCGNQLKALPNGKLLYSQCSWILLTSSIDNEAQCFFMHASLHYQKAVTSLVSLLWPDFSGLHKLRLLYVDNNYGLKHFPATVAQVERLGAEGCSVLFKGDNPWRVLPLHLCGDTVPTLMELCARVLNVRLKGQCSVS